MRGRPERRLLSLTLLARLSPSTSLTCAPRVLSRLVAGWGGAISAWWVGFLCGGGGSGRHMGLALDLHPSLRLSKLCAPRRGMCGLGPGRRRL